MPRRTNQMYVRSAASEARLRSIGQRKTQPHNPSKRPITLAPVKYPELVESEQEQEEKTNG